MTPSTYLVFGDLHGRVLPAFALARAWQREHAEPVAALLQVGDLGYFPFPDRLDRATKKFAQDDPLELGVQQLVHPSPEADALFAAPDVPGPLWFVAGNHEDHQALVDCYGLPGSGDDDFPVDHYRQLYCIADGHVATLPGGLRVAGLWGTDTDAPRARRHVRPEARLNPRSAKQLAMRSFDVLLTHESPRDAFFPDAGSEAISFVLEQAKPALAFFGHYHGEGRLDECDFGPTQVYHLAGLEFRGRGRSAEERCVGVLRMGPAGATFSYVEPSSLRTVTRDNWPHR
jgi:hypothetical protein